jgi:hypothetical protein
MPSLITLLFLLATVIYVVYLVVKTKHKEPRQEDNRNEQLLAELKSNADVYKLNFDYCTFRDSSYITEVEEDNREAKIAGLLVGSSIGYLDTPVVREENTQTVLFYSDPAVQNGRRFFQTFYMEMTTLKYHVLTGHVSLLVARNDPDKYFFELIS